MELLDELRIWEKMYGEEIQPYLTQQEEVQQLRRCHAMSKLILAMEDTFQGPRTKFYALCGITLHASAKVLQGRMQGGNSDFVKTAAELFEGELERAIHYAEAAQILEKRASRD